MTIFQFLASGAKWAIELRSGLGMVLVAIFAVVGAVATGYAVYLGFLLAKAEDESKRQQAKKRIFSTVSGLMIIVILTVVLINWDLSSTTDRERTLARNAAVEALREELEKPENYRIMQGRGSTASPGFRVGIPTSTTTPASLPSAGIIFSLDYVGPSMPIPWDLDEDGEMRSRRVRLNDDAVLMVARYGAINTIAASQHHYTNSSLVNEFMVHDRRNDVVPDGYYLQFYGNWNEFRICRMDVPGYNNPDIPNDWANTTILNMDTNRAVRIEVGITVIIPLELPDGVDNPLNRDPVNWMRVEGNSYNPTRGYRDEQYISVGVFQAYIFITPSYFDSNSGGQYQGITYTSSIHPNPQSPSTIREKNINQFHKPWKQCSCC